MLVSFFTADVIEKEESKNDSNQDQSPKKYISSSV